MKFCPNCGHALAQRIPPGDSRMRAVCPACQSIHYQNPRLVVGTVPLWQEQILLCRRAIEPRYGYWTLPAGFLEVGETTAQGALRETLEEAGAQVELGRLFSLIDIPHAEQVHVFYLAQLQNLDFQAGEETLEQRLFSEADIPWRELAFSSVRETLQHYFTSRQQTVTHTSTLSLTITQRGY